MMSVPAFGVSLALLLAEGWCAVNLVLFSRSSREGLLLCLALALPFAALFNVLLFLLFMLCGIPLTTVSLWIGHACIVAGLLLVRQFLPPTGHDSDPALLSSLRLPRIIIALCLFILAGALVYGFAHAWLLPPFQYDSFTNWLMRSKMSFLEQRLVFDNAFPHEAVRKPHYPFLVHALHLMANAGQSSWRDQLASGMTFLLSVSLLFGSFLMIRRVVGASLALFALTLVVGIPLFGLHLGEGYADHLLAEEGLAALAAFALYRSSGRKSVLLLSGLLAAAAVWTKAEGMFFVFLPWLLLALLSVRPLALRPLFPPLLLAAVWPVFLFLKGLAFTPHGSTDLLVDYHPESLRTVLSVLLYGGSFGPFWPLLFAGMVCLAIASARRSPGATFGGGDRRERLSLFLPGALCFAIVIGVYVFTPNVSYLLNGESFDRQLLTPAAMLVLPLVLCFAEFVKGRGEEG
ncbi:MAG: hypothetical protein PHX93_05565 [Candidatus Peribacteraceae bacterium]|jgi:hypothetical protein|nr:hypothetical protein [Candidatus Peribacteraceae bacterium]